MSVSIVKMDQSDRQEIKDGLFMASMVLGAIARRTKTPIDDKLAKALGTLVMPQNEALLDQFIDIIDKSVGA